MHMLRIAGVALAAALVIGIHSRARAAYSFVEGYNVLDTNNAPSIGTNFAATSGFERDIAVDSARGIIYIARGQQTTTDGRVGGVAGIAAIVVTNGARAGSNFRDTGLIDPVNNWCQSLAYDPVGDRIWVLGGSIGASPIIYSAPGGTLGGAPNGDGIASPSSAFVQAFRVNTNLLETGVYVSPEVSTNGIPGRGGTPRGFAVRTAGGVTTVYLGMGNHVQAWSNDQPLTGTNSPWRRIWATLRPPATTSAGTRVGATFSGVNGVAVDNDGNCYFSVQGSGGRIWCVRPSIIEPLPDKMSLDFNDTAFGGASEKDVIPLLMTGSAGAAVTNNPQSITFCRIGAQKTLFVSFLPAALQRGITRLEIDESVVVNSVRAAIVDGFGSGQPAGEQDAILLTLRNKATNAAPPITQPWGGSNATLYSDVDDENDPAFIFVNGFVTDTNKGQTLPTAAVIKVAISANTNPPSISVQPSPQTLLEGGTINLSVGANGMKPLSYQWQSNSVDILDATNASYVVRPASTNDTSLYRVVVTNAVGSITSTQVQVTVNPLVRSEALTTPSWRIAPGTVPYLTTDNTQRGMTYNPATGRVLVASRNGGSNSIVSLDAVDPLNGAWYLGTNGIAGGTLALNMIGAGDDGVVYGCNLAQNAELFRMYRWGSDESDLVPDVAFSAAANSLGATRWGDSLDVRNSGLDNTLQILAGSRNSNVVTIFTTGDGGLSLQANMIRVPGAPNGAFGLSVSFGHGNTFWGKGDGSTTLRLVEYDLANGTGVVVRAYGTPTYTQGATVIGFEPTRNLIAAISLENPDNLRLYDVSDLVAGPRLVDQELFLTDNDNVNATGAIDFSSDRVFALDSNNGLISYTIGTIPAGPPGRITITRSGPSVTLTWSGNYILQSATGVTNTFTDVNGATSGYTEDVNTAAEKYFRLRN